MKSGSSENISSDEVRLATEGLTKKFGPITVVEDVTLSISPGSCLAVFGPNGAGKTTLLKMLSLLIRPTAGTIWVDGEPACLGSEGLNLQAKIGFLTHQPLLYGHLTSLENMHFYGKLYGVSDLRLRAKKVLDEVGLLHRSNDPVRKFSRGMLQRLAIARAILHQPNILFLDEPFTGLDRSGARMLGQTLDRLQLEGCSLVLTTHDFDRGLNLCDQWMILHQGRIRHYDRRNCSNKDDFAALYESLTEEGR